MKGQFFIIAFLANLISKHSDYPIQFNACTYEFRLNNDNMGADVSQELKANQYYLIWITQYSKEIKAHVFKL